MERPTRLALPIVLLAAVVVSLRGIVAFEPVRESVDLRTLALLSQGLWSLVAVVGFPAVGYARGERTDGTPPARTLRVAGVAAYVSALAGTLVLRLGPGASPLGPLPVELAGVGVFALLDAATFGLFVLGGYALSGGQGTR